MVTVRGTDATTLPVPDGIVPLPLIVTVEVPGEALSALACLLPLHDERKMSPHAQANTKRTLELLLNPGELRRTEAIQNPERIAGSNIRPARVRLFFPCLMEPVTAPEPVLMVIVPWAGFSLPSAF